MGAITSRQNAGVEEVDVISNHAYKYPPRSGNYFGNHFIMGGERFDTSQPESYLFGENLDLNFLGSRPTAFPYPPPQSNEPTKTLKSLVNIRKESLRFVRAPPDYCSKLDNNDDDDDDDATNRNLDSNKTSLYNIEFTFDCDVRCTITIYYLCTEEITSNGVTYVSRDATMNSETYSYKRGANQQFCQMSHCFDPTRYTEEELVYNAEKEIIPIAIHCIADEGPEDMRQSHTTIAIVEKHTDGTFVLKALKQKLFVDGLCYLLQEIYGIENKHHDNKMAGDEDMEDNGSECVICMCDVRDTLILPCRHLCLCNSCADSLRYQANNCPICRAPFRALLQIRALQKCMNIVQQQATQQLQLPTSPSETACDHIPSGYEAVSLIEALNGPCLLRQPPAAVLDMVETPDVETAVQAAEILNRGGDKTPTKGSVKELPSSATNHHHHHHHNSTPEFRMSVLMSRDEEMKETQKSPLLMDDKLTGYNRAANKNLLRSRDTVRHVNEKNAVEKDEIPDEEDSEAEKMSPLLVYACGGGVGSEVSNSTTNGNSNHNIQLALDMAGVVEPIDDTDTEHDDHLNHSVEHSNNSVQEKVIGVNHRPTAEQSDYYLLIRDDRAQEDESDYYTPEDPAPVLLYNNNNDDDHTQEQSKRLLLASSVESTPQRGPMHSLPGTPLSHISVRSSADSFGSNSSTKHLLAVIQTGSNNRLQI